MGYCLPKETLDRAFNLFIEKESEVLAVVSDFDLMSDGSKKKSLACLKDFYDIIKDVKKRDKSIVKKCMD